jgi:hypothetical protein
MRNNIRVPNRQRKSADYLAARENWLRHVLANRDLSQRAKIVANALYFHFNYEEFANDGGLWAWPSLRTLDKATGQSRTTVIAAIKDLEAAGYLKPSRRYDPLRRRFKSHLYLALRPKTVSASKVHRLNHPGSDGCTGVVQTGGTDSMNENMNELVDLISETAGSLACARALRSPANPAHYQSRPHQGGEGEFEEERASKSEVPTSTTETSGRTAPDSNQDSSDKPYTHIDVEIVRDAIEDRGLTDIAAIAVHARGKGRWLSENIIRAMCQDGLFPALGGPPAR